ncbi:uncharacterized protein LOC135665986 [Musa acuminata AAA Group]|uniref:uncharacterized protein LOC135629696 n=1 Tax=Musa acuminata AAA Group TaxID=214697 RepID=UPI0031CF67C8
MSCRTGPLHPTFISHLNKPKEPLNFEVNFFCTLESVEFPPQALNLSSPSPAIHRSSPVARSCGGRGAPLPVRTWGSNCSPSDLLSFAIIITTRVGRPSLEEGKGERSKAMVRDRDVPPAVRVYTVCDESRYLIVRNVPALGCGDDLSRLFGSYGEIEECKPMDAEDCDPFTDVYWIKFSQVSNARFAKRKLDESVFLGNLLKVSYAPQFESVLDVKEKLEGRTKEVLGRIKSANVRTEGSKSQISSNSTIIGSSCQHWLDPAPSASSNSELQGRQREFARGGQISHVGDAPLSHVSSNKEYFPTPSMNETVRLVREKLDKIQSRSGNTDTASASKRAKVDNRRRI